MIGPSSTRRLTRRQALLAAGSGSAAVLAGCSGGGGGNEDDESAMSDDGDDDGGSMTDGSADGFEIEGDFDLPTDPDHDDFADRTGQEVVEIETMRRPDADPEFVFTPPFVRVDAGTTIRWRNGGGVFHTVTATESLEDRSTSGKFNETIASEGDTFEWEAAEPGVQNYYCTPHAGFMFGAIEIV